jgi:hypothetical protein
MMKRQNNKYVFWVFVAPIILIIFIFSYFVIVGIGLNVVSKKNRKIEELERQVERLPKSYIERLFGIKDAKVFMIGDLEYLVVYKEVDNEKTLIVGDGSESPLKLEWRADGNILVEGSDELLNDLKNYIGNDLKAIFDYFEELAKIRFTVVRIHFKKDS